LPANVFGGAEPSLIAHERHRAALAETLAALERGLNSGQSEIELIAEDLRLAERALRRIAGRVDVEDVLGAIFARLCVGK
jgi:tRNA modification GTPase